MPDDRCTWCGHRHDSPPCPVTRTDKTPCPCARPRFVTHNIACTEGCNQPELCDNCQCHQEDQ